MPATRSATRSATAAKPSRPVKARPAPTAARRSAAKPAPGKVPARKVAQARVRKVEEPAAAPAGARIAKVKLVRDSFSIPRSEYQVLQDLKERLVGLARPAKKSEVLRAGIALLATLDDAALLSAVAVVPSIKTGRPKKSR